MKMLNTFLAPALLAGLFMAILSLVLLPGALAQIAGQVPRATPAAASAQTVVPALVPYSGVALSADGKPLVVGTGEVGVTFLIYRDEQGGEPLWTETQTVAVDSTGHYKVELGAGSLSGLPMEVFASGQARWLEVQIAGQSQQPRVLLSSVPYALKAADAATLGGLPASAFVLAGSPNAAAAVIPETSLTVTTGGGTANYLPEFTGTSTIGDSIIYATGNSVGIGDVPNSSVKLDVNGAIIMRGEMIVSRTGNATTAKGFPSYGFEFFSNAYNSTSKTNDNPYFQLQSEPTGNNTGSPSATFNLLFANNGGAIAETGLFIKPTGVINFASGQTFPGTGTITGITTGTGLVGGGTSGNIALSTTAVLSLLAGTGLTETASSEQNLTLGIDTNVVPELTTENFFTDNMRIDGYLYVDSSDGYAVYAQGSSSSPDGATLYADNSISSVGNALAFSAIGSVEGGYCDIDVTGNLLCSGTLTGNAKHFRIDHPLDPANKYLVHSSVESSEMMNIYSGNVVTDGAGVATVTLPDWFESENGDFRYQLTTIGRKAQAWVSEEVHDGKFTIATDTQNVKVSWQITAVRQDAYAKANPLVVEEAKPIEEQGTYMHPELFGQPREKGTGWARHEKQMQRMKAHRPAGTNPPAPGAATVQPVAMAKPLPQLQ